MADNFNISLPGAAQGAQDVLNLGPSIAQNAANTQNQQQLVDQAVEHTKQAQIQTGEAQNVFDTQAYLSEKGLMPKAQAIAELKLVLQRQGAEDDEIQKDVAMAEDEFPEELDGQSIWRFYSALREPKQAAVKSQGQAFQADGSEKDNQGSPFAKGTWIQESADSEGNQVFVHSAEPASVQTAGIKADASGSASNEKQWQALNKEIMGAMKSRYGGVGQMITTITRADRAMNTITHSNGPNGNLSKQDLENISTDIAAIYQGGVPGVTQIVENSYGTTLTNLMDTLRHYTGVLSGFGMNQQVLADTKKKLMGVLNDMRNSAIAQIQEFVEAQFPAYRTLIESDPERWAQMKQGILNFVTSGTMNESGQVNAPTGVPAMAGGNAAPQGAANDPLGIR